MSTPARVRLRPSAGHEVTIEVDGAELSVVGELGVPGPSWTHVFAGLALAHRRDRLSIEQIAHYGSFVEELLHDTPSHHNIFDRAGGPPAEFLDARRLEVLAELIDPSRVPRSTWHLDRWASIFESDEERIQLAALVAWQDPIEAAQHDSVGAGGWEIPLATAIRSWVDPARSGRPLPDSAEMASQLRSLVPPMLLDQDRLMVLLRVVEDALWRVEQPVPPAILTAVWFGFVDPAEQSLSPSELRSTGLAKRFIADPECPPERLWHLADCDPVGVARHRSCPADLAELIASAAPLAARVELALDWAVPIDELMDLLVDATPEVADVVASSATAPPESLEMLARSTDAQVRRCVACHLRMPLDVLELLVDDPDLAVRRAARLNPRVVQRYLREVHDSLRNRGGTWTDSSSLLSDEWPYPRSVRLTHNQPGRTSDYLAGGLARHPATPPDILLDLVENWDGMPAEFVLDRPDCPVEAMWAAVAQDRHVGRVLSHRDCPREIALAVAGRAAYLDVVLDRFGDDPAVRAAALGTLRSLSAPVPLRRQIPAAVIEALLAGPWSAPSAGSYMVWWNHRRPPR